LTRSTPTNAALAFLYKAGNAPERLAKIEFKVTLPQAAGNAASGQTEH
jgi:hypothetical protein